MSRASTIFAVSSGAGRAGVAVIRLSGSASRESIERLAGGVIPDSRRTYLRTIRHPTSGEMIDRGLVMFFAAPASMTGEDMAELHVHGGAAVVSGCLAALASLPGLVAAEAGEFTRRAFRNGKMDLAQAEGLADLLNAEGEAQRRQALFHMTGEASRAVESWFDDAMAILARLEAAIDFVEEADVAASALSGVRPRIVALVKEISVAVAGAARTAAVRDGMRIAIVGAPNVGKSSLLNALAGREAAIVSPIAGTTRDTIEVRLMLAGLPVIISDTAGLRANSQDEIERLGMERSHRVAASAHLVLRVVAPDVESDFEAAQGEVVVLNKLDLPEHESIHTRNKPDVEISTRTGQGVDDLLARMEDRVRAEYSMQESPIAVRERHVNALSDSIRLLNDSLTFGPEQLELAAEAVRGAAHSLARITGRVDVEDLLGRIFAEFCVGK